jgi:selenocysteine-specific elongation factor
VGEAPDGPIALTIGTAGHVDHGKTTLVRYMTGTDTDRLEEEHRRGISIVPGYAELELPSGRRASLVDVPGHERFVKNMVSGATG